MLAVAASVLALFVAHRIDHADAPPSLATSDDSRARNIVMRRTKPTLEIEATANAFAPVPSQLRDSRSPIVATPGCGTYERFLSLPERRSIPEDEQEDVREILEDLRSALLEQNTSNETDQPDLLSHDGVIELIRYDWAHLSTAERNSVRQALQDGVETALPLVRRIREVNIANALALHRLSEILGAGRALDVWTALSWCSTTLE